MTDPLLETADVRKAFAGVHALRGVSFSLRAGEVHALVGENGAGKSTLINIMTGAVAADSGTLAVDGRAVAHMDPATAKSLGIAAIYQHPALFPDLTVAENIGLSLERGRAWRRIDWRARRAQARALIRELGATIDPERRVETLSMPERQLVEIAKAIGANSRVLIMDEPTASLTHREIDHLLTMVRRLRDRGVGIIYISHKLDEIFALADRVTVLRDGESIVTRAARTLDARQLVQLMVGRDLTTIDRTRQAAAGDVGLELRGVTNSRRGIKATTLAVRRGEILGIAGLVGAGRTELAETIFGITPADGGDVVVNGTRAVIRSPGDAMQLGIGYVPEDRQRHGVIADMSIAANTTLNNLAAVAAAGLIDRAREDSTASQAVHRLHIKASSVRAAVSELSGGNQQKVALARWLSAKTTVLILDEPTQGIDIAAKAEIHQIVERLAENGVAVVLISSELPELLAMADRIAVMRAGVVEGIVDRADATPERVMALAFGHAA